MEFYNKRQAVCISVGRAAGKAYKNAESTFLAAERAGKKNQRQANSQSFL